ncbi:MAG: class II aldolase/adducin family protein [Anaerolinea sp.]|nr:class II aldolase/adducin family protein [Anaerolinea sp.]
MSNHDLLQQLVHLSRALGDPARDYAILGEGNTSTRASDATFWVKASGTELRTIDAAGFVEVRFDRVLAMLSAPTLSDAEIKQGLIEAKLDAASGGHPSVETVLHAVCLQLEGINFVGHTHPTAINALTCSVGFDAAFAGRLFPDEIVVLGPAPVLIPYVDPGPPLARAVKAHIDAHIDYYGEVPKVIHMQNHGLIALGRSAQQVENITAMAVKAARILAGTYAMGGPNFMSAEAVARIHTRPDEHYRQRVIAAGA